MSVPPTTLGGQVGLSPGVFFPAFLLFCLSFFLKKNMLLVLLPIIIGREAKGVERSLALIIHEFYVDGFFVNEAYSVVTCSG
jgi:hypothetical protein